MELNDRDAVRLLTLLDLYIVDAVREGITLTEVGNTTVQELVRDIVPTLPPYEAVNIPASVSALADD